MVYSELEKKDKKNMWTVMIWGTIGTTITYLIVGIFGYVTFAAYTNVDYIMEK